MYDDDMALLQSVEKVDVNRIQANSQAAKHKAGRYNRGCRRRSMVRVKYDIGMTLRVRIV